MSFFKKKVKEYLCPNCEEELLKGATKYVVQYMIDNDYCSNMSRKYAMACMSIRGSMKSRVIKKFLCVSLDAQKAFNINNEELLHLKGNSEVKDLEVNFFKD